MYLSQKLLDRIEQRRETSKEQSRGHLREGAEGQRSYDERAGLLREILRLSEQVRSSDSSTSDQD